MRGETERQAAMMLGLTPEGFVPADHLLRWIKALVRMSLLFEQIYPDSG